MNQLGAPVGRVTVLAPHESNARTLDAIGTLSFLAIGAAIWFGAATTSGVAVVLLLGAILVAAWSPSAAVAACLVALPTVFSLHALPWGSFSLVELAIIVGVCGYGLRRLLEEPLRWWRADVGALLSPVAISLPVLALVAAAGVSLLTVANPAFLRESVREVRLVIVVPVAFLCLARLVWRDGEARTWAAWCLTGVGAIVAGLAIGEVALGLGGIAGTEVARASATYPHPNNLALFLERSTLFTAGGVAVAPRSRLLWALLLLQLGGVVATLSRGAVLAVVVGAVALMAWIGSSRGLKMVVAGLVPILLYMLLFARDRLFDGGSGGDEPTRFALWRSSIRMIQDSVFTGVGPDQFLYQYWRRYVEPAAWPERFTAHPHNLVLDIWLRLGIAGLAVAAWLFAGIVRRARRHQGTADPIAAGGVAALAGGLAHGMVDNGFFLPDLAVLTWACVAWLVTTRHVSP